MHSRWGGRDHPQEGENWFLRGEKLHRYYDDVWPSKRPEHNTQIFSVSGVFKFH